AIDEDARGPGVEQKCALASVDLKGETEAAEVLRVLKKFRKRSFSGGGLADELTGTARVFGAGLDVFEIVPHGRASLFVVIVRACQVVFEEFGSLSAAQL